MTAENEGTPPTTHPLSLDAVKQLFTDESKRKEAFHTMVATVTKTKAATTTRRITAVAVAVAGALQTFLLASSSSSSDHLQERRNTIKRTILQQLRKQRVVWFVTLMVSFTIGWTANGTFTRVETVRSVLQQEFVAQKAVAAAVAIPEVVVAIEKRNETTTTTATSTPPNKNSDSKKAPVPKEVVVERSSKRRKLKGKQPKYQENILDKVVRKLISNKRQANDYIQKYPGNDFRFYVYEDSALPTDYTWRNISKCIEKRYKVKVGEKNSSSCDWGSTICIDNSTTGTYLKRRHNRNADVILAKVFTEYTGPLRTYHPQEADLFVVPYPNAGHCECRKRTFRCGRDIQDAELQTKLIDHLQYYNQTTKAKHLFLASIIWVDMHQFFKNLDVSPLVTTLGQSSCRENDINCGRIVIPYANTNPEYQPNTAAKVKNEHRQFALSAIMSTKISGNGFDRVSFFETVHNLTSVGAKPFHISSLHRSRSLKGEKEILEQYRNTTFCPCLRGDQAPQKRIFDAILSGCIPVVVEHKQSNEVGWSSHFASKSFSLRQTYPFSRGAFHNHPGMGIDYPSLMIELPGECGMDCLLPYLEKLMLQRTDLIQQKQESMERVRSLLSYGMEHNALQYADAVAAILVQARHFILQQQQKQKQQQQQQLQQQ